MLTLLLVLLLALVFVYINGFHDTANAIATVVSTRALSMRAAIVLATVTNLAGALVGVAVAETMAHGLVQAQFVSLQTILCALVGAIVWDLITWWRGLPTSSSHALVGGLCGAVLASAQNHWQAITWVASAPGPWWQANGVAPKVILPMLVSPLIGFVVAFLVSSLLYLGLRSWVLDRVDTVFGKLQIVSAGFMGFEHGHNDAQKTVGVVLLALLAAAKAGSLEHLPGWLGFLRIAPGTADQELPVPLWLRLTCAVVLAAGTAAGGWRIMRTLGHRLADLKPIHGFAAETTAAGVLSVAAFFGFPVSTTHTITAAVAGVGASRRFRAMHLKVVKKIAWAWLLTLPAAGLVAYAAVLLCQLAGWK